MLPDPPANTVGGYVVEGAKGQVQCNVTANAAVSDLLQRNIRDISALFPDASCVPVNSTVGSFLSGH